MKWIAAVLLSFFSLGCESTPPSFGTKPALRFSVTPYGDRHKATEIRMQKGGAIPEPITNVNFQEVTIAQGSGRDGFDAIRVFKNRSGYLVFSESSDTNKKVSIELSEEEVEGLFHALNQDRIAKIMGSYSTDLHDGVQGFIEVKAGGNRRFSWMSNHFDPVENTYHYCNKVIWPKSTGARIETRGIERQEEYYRVFQPEKQNKPAMDKPDSAAS